MELTMSSNRLGTKLNHLFILILIRRIIHIPVFKIQLQLFMLTKSLMTHNRSWAAHLDFHIKHFQNASQRGKNGHFQCSSWKNNWQKMLYTMEWQCNSLSLTTDSWLQLLRGQKFLKNYSNLWRLLAFFVGKTQHRTRIDAFSLWAHFGFEAVLHAAWNDDKEVSTTEG